MTGAAFRKLAASLPGAEARPHMDRMAFRTPRKIFATLTADGREANVLLDLDTQAELSEMHPEAALVKRVLADAHALAMPKTKPKKR